MRSTTVAALLGLALPLAAQVPNDECATALPVSPGLVVGSTTGATDSPEPACEAVGADVWYTFTAPSAGSLLATFCDWPGFAEFYGVLGIYTGSCGALTELACGIEEGDCLGFGAEATADLAAGETCWIRVGGELLVGGVGDAGDFELWLQFDPVPVNDECAGALPVTDGLLAGDTFGATTSAVTGSCNDMGSDVWYAYSATVDGSLTASFCYGGGSSGGFDQQLAVFTGDCGTLAEVTCTYSDTFCIPGLGSTNTSFPIQAGETYYLAVGGWKGDQGAFSLSLQSATPPVDDACFAATPIEEGHHVGDNFGATSGAPLGSCHGGAIDHDVWYRYEPTESGRATIEFGDAIDFVGAVAVFEGECGAPTEVACDQIDWYFSMSSLTFGVAAGHVYHLAVGGFGPQMGSFEFDLSLEVTQPGLGDRALTSVRRPGADVLHAGASTRVAGVGGVLPQGEPFLLPVPSLPPGAVAVEAWASWNFLLDGEPPPTHTVSLNGVPLVGDLAGAGAYDLCWGKERAATWAAPVDLADVLLGAPNLVAGATDGPVGTDPAARGEGLSIVVVYEVPGEALRNVEVFAGYTSTWPTGGIAPVDLRPSVCYTGGEVRVLLNALDGTVLGDDLFAGGTLVSGLLAGTSGPGNAWAGLLGPDPAGQNLYDAMHDDLSPYVFATHDGNVELTTRIVAPGDCVAHTLTAMSYEIPDLPATAVARAGSPPNPVALLNGAAPAAVGTTWTPVVDHASFVPAATLDLLIVTGGPANVPSPSGTILCDLAQGTYVFTAAPGAPFELPVPSGCGFPGKTVCAQAASLDASGLHLTNALDVTIGTH